MNIQDLITAMQGGVTGSLTTVIVVIGAVVAVAILVAAGFYIAHLMSPRGRLESLLDSRVQGRKNPWPMRIVVVTILLVSVLSIGAYLDSPATCASCHSEAKYYKSLQSTVHKNVSCMSCHGATGVVAPVDNTITYARWGWGYWIEAQPPEKTVTAQVDASSCLGCHGNVLSGTQVANGIRVRHKDFLDKGVSCDECHGDVAHDGPVARKNVSSPSMSQCVTCHDGTKASSECTTCHVKDFALTNADSLAQQGGKVKVAGGWDVCYRCHSQTPCLGCHGVTMPHPPNWGPSRDASGNATPGLHVPYGFKYREYCYRCHFQQGKQFQYDVKNCQPCHNPAPGSMHGGPGWVKEHGLEATGKKGGELSECFICHGSDLCSYCHPKSYLKRYNPKQGGYDSYPRVNPRTPAEQQWVNGL